MRTTLVALLLVAATALVLAPAPTAAASYADCNLDPVDGVGAYCIVDTCALPYPAGARIRVGVLTNPTGGDMYFC